ncbi:hypothetical protein D3C77_695730 [compost metagenome]
MGKSFLFFQYFEQNTTILGNIQAVSLAFSFIAIYYIFHNHSWTCIHNCIHKMTFKIAYNALPLNGLGQQPL